MASDKTTTVKRASHKLVLLWYAASYVCALLVTWTAYAIKKKEILGPVSIAHLFPGGMFLFIPLDGQRPEDDVDAFVWRIALGYAIYAVVLGSALAFRSKWAFRALLGFWLLLLIWNVGGCTGVCAAS